ncbi:MAG: hypothetical protein H0T73_02970 [Ardenticatenales bacterium]|nr:hypothetical protein [Ardenticatenales bacterium]
MKSVIHHPLRTILLALFGVTLLLRVLTALTLEHAGYFDAFYYYHIAQNMAEGRGITESVIWNYLDDPQSLPRPGNQYWMPLTNVLAWLGLVTSGWLLGPWRAAQFPFVLLGSLLPPLAAWISWLGWQRRDWAISAGVLTIFSGFYFTYWVVTDSFTPFALSVALALISMWKAQESGAARWWALAGVGAALSHLTRIDGALLVPLIALLIIWQTLRGPQRNGQHYLRWSSAAALGYLLLIGPWSLRNWLVTGTPFPGGGTQTLWLRQYGEIFAYEPDLSLARYLAWGIGPIIGSKLNSLLWSSLIVLGSTQFFLAPFIFLSLREAARRSLFRPFLFYTLMLLTAMPLIFTFPAIRGSLLHSSAALIPWMMALVPPGIERAVTAIAARRRSWDAAQASQIFGMGFVMVAAIITMYIYIGGVWLDPAPDAPTAYERMPVPLDVCERTSGVSGPSVARWNERTVPFEEVEAWMTEQGVAKEERIFVGDPPSFHVMTRRPALVIPIEGPETIARAAREWDAPWLLLDRDRPGPYCEMYEKQLATAGWRPVAAFVDALGHPVILFHFEP